MKIKPKKPTLREKIAVYEQLLHDLQFYRCVAMNDAAVRELLNRIDEWSYAHRSGERAPAEIEEQVNYAFWKLKRPGA